MRALVAWRGGQFLTEGKIVVLSVSSLFLTRVGVYVCVSVCIRTHTHTLHRCSDVFFGHDLFSITQLLTILRERPARLANRQQKVGRRESSCVLEKCLNVSKGARFALCALVLPVLDSLVGRSASPRRSALDNMVSFYWSVTVGSSKTERRDRGTTRERKHRTDSTEGLHMEDTLKSRMWDHTDGP